jgi:hypothetical protein
MNATQRLGALALGAYAVLLAATAPAWPDDWDGVGFVESIHDFDLARFHPHPPGYPVYVALLRIAALVAREPMRASVAVSVASGLGAVALLWGAARRAAGERAAWATAVLTGVAPLVWRSCSGVGSEAPALACAAACLWGLAAAPSEHRAAPLVLGLGAGLGLGVRLSWAPLYLPLLALAARGNRARAWATAGAACVAWAVPLLALVGPARLAALFATHFAGHAERWGGTIATEPGMVRLAWLARDVLVDGLGAGAGTLGIGIAAASAVCAAQGLVEWRRRGWRGWRCVLLAVVPYVVWIGLGQNLREQPRHALPLVAALAAALGLAAHASRRALAVVAALALLVSIRTAADAHERRTIPPPGQQLVDLARAQPAPERLAVFGASSVRFFETTELAGHAFTAGSLGDVQVRLTRLDTLPDRVWVTSEVQGRRDSPWPLEHVATLCRPPRIDRRSPCVDVFDWKLPYLGPLTQLPIKVRGSEPGSRGRSPPWSPRCYGRSRCRGPAGWTRRRRC